MKNKPEALKFMLTRLRVLEKAAQALHENATFSSAGNWEVHMTVEAMRAQLPVWIKTLEASLKSSSEPEEPRVEHVEDLPWWEPDEKRDIFLEILEGLERSLESDVARDLIKSLKSKYMR